MPHLPPLQFAAEEGAVLGGVFLAGVAGGAAEGIGERVGHHERFVAARVRVTVNLRAVAEPGVDGDGLVRRERPGGRRPDDDAGLARQRAGGEREFYINGRGIVLVVFDLGFREGGPCAGAPVDGFLALVDQPALDEPPERADDLRLVAGVEREIGMLPVAEDAQALELAALDVDELARQFLRFLADHQRRQPLVLLDDLELDGQSVAIPAGDVGRAETGHGLGLDDHVLENLVERRAHVNVAVGEGRAVVQDEERRAGARALNLPVKVGFLPVFEEFRFAGDQIRLHGKIGPGQVERFFVTGAHGIDGKDRQPTIHAERGQTGWVSPPGGVFLSSRQPTRECVRVSFTR